MTNAPAQPRKVADLKCIWKRSAVDQQEFYALHFNSVHDIPAAEWNNIVENKNAFLALGYLAALEDTHDSGLELRFVMFQNSKNEFIGIAAFQITHFITSPDAYSNQLLKWINQLAKFIRRGHVHNILICGNALATGEHGFYFSNSYANALSEEEKARLVLDAMQNISADEKKNGKRICAMVAKDFYPTSDKFPLALSRRGFTSFQVDHNMVMPLLAEWKSFDDYLAALNTKFRTKAKAAFKKSEQLAVRPMTAEEILKHCDRMQHLYSNVYDKADFRLGKLNVHALSLMIKNMPYEFFVTGLFLKEELVGFCTAVKTDQSIEAHVIGIDYENNREHCVYQRILYEYISLGIKLQCNRIVYGRTAAEIKSTIGAMPVDLTCSIYHPRTISNALLNLILNYVKPSDYPHRNPWRAEVFEEIKNAKLF
jgi:predicted N-acyltransferase